MIENFSTYQMNERVIYPLDKRLGYVIRDITRLGYPNPYQANEIIIDDNIGVKFKILDDMVWITNINALDKRTNVVLESISKLFQIAKEYNIKVGLSPFLARESGFRDDRLLKWFMKLGVIRQDGKYIFEPHF